MKVGDRVVIRPDLEPHENYRAAATVRSMMVFRGQPARITHISMIGVIRLDIDNGGWAWTEEMFCRYSVDTIGPDD